MPATLNVIFGPCGAGKTTYARAFAKRERAVAFILDDWIARLFHADMEGAVDYEWMLERVARCEAQIWSTAAAVIAAGAPVILDIGLMRRADRARIAQIADATGLPLKWHFVDAPQDVRWARVTGRNAQHGETFAIEVTPENFAFIEELYEPPAPDELEGAIVSESD